MKAWRTLLYIVSVIALLAAVCVFFPEDGITIAGTTIRFPSLHKVLAPNEPTLDDILAQQQREEELRRLAGINDTVGLFRSQFSESDLRFWFPNDDVTFFDSLFAQMEGAQKHKRMLRVLHYGDSQIEMDRLSVQLREYFQDNFGGGGPGMLPIQKLIPSTTVSQSSSGAFTLQSSYGSNDSVSYRADGNYGPMNQCFRLTGSGFASVRASSHPSISEKMKRFSRVTIIFNNRPGPFSCQLSAPGYSVTQECSQSGVHQLTWQLDSAVSNFKLNLSGTADVYGMLVDDSYGVTVDNIPMRGCSGQQFCLVNKEQVVQAYSFMDIGLVIMQFGGNSVPYLNNEKSIDTYCESIGKQIDRVHQNCPKATILFIGPSDMSTKINGELQSYPSLPRVIERLRETANAHNAAYWSIYHAMGGKNSMVAWVNAGMAGSDYIHFAGKGVEKMGASMCKAFDQMYQFYLYRKQLTSSQFDSIWNAKY